MTKYVKNEIFCQWEFFTEHLGDFNMVNIQKTKGKLKIEDFVKNGEITIFSNGSQEAEQNYSEPRKAIGYNREKETITVSSANELLASMGYRRAIGYGRTNERIKDGEAVSKQAIGYGRDHEPAGQPAKAKTRIGFKVREQKTR